MYTFRLKIIISLKIKIIIIIIFIVFFKLILKINLIYYKYTKIHIKSTII